MSEAAENGVPQDSETRILSPAEQLKIMKKPWLRMDGVKVANLLYTAK